MRLTSESKFFVGIIGVTLVIIIAAVVVLSRPAKPIEKSLLIPPSTHTVGNTGANVWLVEFSDFQCPACHVFADAITELADTHKDTLLVAYRHFPLPQHSYSVKAAIAAESAGRQGKFWEMGNLLFNNQDSLSDENVASLASSLLPDMTKFTADLKDLTLKTLVESDRAYAERLGITATPTFYLNGVKLDVRTTEELKNKAEEALNKK